MRRAHNFLKILLLSMAFWSLAFAPGTARAGLWEESPGSSITETPIQSLLRWNPTGTGNNPLSPECRRANLEQVIERGGSVRALNVRLNDWLNRCGSQITRDYSGEFTVLLDLTNLDHDIRSAPLIRKVVFTLSDGRKLSGLMAFKPDDGQKRPLVITKCGIFCDSNDGSTMKSFFMHLFEESPFNVVMLANSTGTEFSKANHSIALGGFDEGFQILDVARILMSEEAQLAKRVSTLHVMGFSLGSNGVLFSSLYSSFPENNFPKISSAMAVCPVVDLGPTMRRGFSPSARGLYYRILTLQTLREVFSSVPILGDLLNLDRRVGASELYRGLTEAATRYYGERTQKKAWPYMPFKDYRINTADDLWRANHFQDHLQDVKVPTLLVHSIDDYFVESDINSLVVETMLKKQPSDFLGVMGFLRGNHCALAAANGWDTVTTLFRSFVLANSPGSQDLMRESKIKIRDYVRDWRWPMNYSLWKDEKVARVGWEMKSGSDKVRLSFRVFSPYQNECFKFSNNLGEAPYDCIRTIIGKVPLAALKPLGIRTPQTLTEAETMSRWLNTHFDVMSTSGRPLHGTGDEPDLAVFRGRYEL